MSQPPVRPLSDSGHENLRDLIWLRNLSIVGQVVVIAIAWYWLKLPLPLPPLGTLVVILAIWNLVSWVRSTRIVQVGPKEFFLQLLVDVLVITGLLYFAGGATNPFAWVYIIPLVLATTLLPRSAAWLMAGLTITCYSALMLWYVPLPGTHPIAHAHGFTQHIFGMWFGFVLSALVIVYFVSDIARNLGERERQLAEAREQALKNERLIALGTLAAGAAHELGTPLGTMAILTRDLLEDYPESRDNELHGQLQILDSQIKRCKEALSVISASSGAAQADEGGSVEGAQYLQDLAQHWLAGRSSVNLELDLPRDPPTREIVIDRTLTQSLKAILDNAADASPDSVTLEGRWNDKRLRIRVLDRGPGLSPLVSGSLGKSQVSTKEQGLGLGLFLAHAAVRRLGGQVWLRDREGGGTCTEVSLPLDRESRE